MFYGKFNPMEYTDKLDDFIRSKVTAYPDVFIIDTDVSCPQSNIPAFVDKLWGQKLVGSHQLSISFSTKLKKKKKKQIETVGQGVCRHVGRSHYIEAWGEYRENAVVGSPVLIILTTLLLSRPCGSGLPRAPEHPGTRRETVALLLPVPVA